MKAANASATDALGALNLYCKKTKVELEEELVQMGNSKVFACTLRYCSVLRSVQATGSFEASKLADAKKGAKRQAAAALIVELSRAS